MARYSSNDGHTTPVNSTVVAIDKDKNSHYAIRWAVDHLFNLINNPNMILVHVRLKNSNRRYLFLSLVFFFTISLVAPQIVYLLNWIYPRNVVADGGNFDKDELNQLFIPYRGYCARKGVYFPFKHFVEHLICIKNP